MSGLIAAPSSFSIDLIAAIVVISMVLGAADIIRFPGWAWKRAEESKAAYLILDLLVPIIGLAFYVFKARPKVAPIAAAGRAASLPFEQFSEELTQMQRDEDNQTGEVTPPVGFGSFGGFGTANELAALAQATPSEIPGQTDMSDLSDSEESPVGAGDTLEVSSTFFSSGATATRSLRPQIGLARAYRPKQRTSLPTPENATPTVPAGWKADPTGRHQFRYWDGFHWTENVANAGEQSMDSVTS